MRREKISVVWIREIRVIRGQNGLVRGPKGSEFTADFTDRTDGKTTEGTESNPAIGIREIRVIRGQMDREREDVGNGISSRKVAKPQSRKDRSLCAL
jgi:hypothetical protein